jgi:serine-type D-Ala-D-Ala carboxypeptidase/endopeptidase (penicillin-binding protein 4)
MLKNLLVTILSLLVLASNAKGQQNQALVSAFNAFKGNPGLQGAACGFCVRDAESGKIIYRYHDSILLIPASDLKIATTAAALELLGNSHRYYTRIGYNGKIDKGRLQGDVLIMGGGDPTLGSPRFEPQLNLKERVIQDLLQAGIKSIDGKVIAESSYFEDKNFCTSWRWDDIGNYFGTGCYGLNYQDNNYAIKLQPGNKPGEKVRMLAVLPGNTGLQFENRLRTGGFQSGDESNIFGEPNDSCRVLQGTIQPSRNPFIIKGSLPDPPGYIARIITKDLAERGMISDEKQCQVNDCKIDHQYINFVNLDSIKSPELQDIVYYTNQKSINLYAESMMKEMGKIVSGSGSAEVGTNVIKKYWAQKRIDTTGIIMEDGCGLSRNDRVSAAQLCGMLARISKETWFDVFLKSLPVSGVSGAMKGMGKSEDIAGKIYCKTGHLESVRAYSGYVKSASGKWVCFSLIINDYTLSSSEIHDEIEKVLEAVASVED